jgi:hypothetical protein
VTIESQLAAALATELRAQPEHRDVLKRLGWDRPLEWDEKS